MEQSRRLNIHNTYYENFSYFHLQLHSFNVMFRKARKHPFFGWYSRTCNIQHFSFSCKRHLYVQLPSGYFRHGFIADCP